LAFDEPRLFYPIILLPIKRPLPGTVFMYYFNQFFLLIFLTVVSQSSSAKQKESFSIGVFNEPSGDRAGAEIIFTGRSDYVGMKLGGVLYASNTKTSDDYESDEVYAGFSAFAFIHTGLVVNPYLGLGIFAGNNFDCSDKEEENGYCAKDSEFAIYPEFGVEINIMNINITPYIRRYFDTNSSSKSNNVYGINLGVNF
jgi:hypothetical protein